MRALTLFFFAALPLLGCGGGDGDPHAKPTADELGNGQRVAGVVGEATWLDPKNTMSVGCASPADRGIHISGATIVAIDKFDETGDGALGNIYIEDTSQDPPDYSAVTVFGASFSPPDLRIAERDVVDLLGTYQEFIGPSTAPFGGCATLPELTGTISFRFDGSKPLPVKTVTIADLKSYVTARPHLGQLIKVENVEVAEDGVNKSGRYSATINVGGGVKQKDIPVIANELYDIEKEGPALKATTKFKSVTGVLTYFFGFHLSPRSAADFEP
jgi:hypothetical protein